MNWFLKLIGGEKLLANAVQQAREERKKEIDMWVEEDLEDDAVFESKLSKYQASVSAMSMELMKLQQSLSEFKEQVPRDIDGAGQYLTARMQLRIESSLDPVKESIEKLDQLLQDELELLRERDITIESSANDARTIAGGAYGTVQAVEEKVVEMEDRLETKQNAAAHRAVFETWLLGDIVYRPPGGIFDDLRDLKRRVGDLED